MMLSVKMSEHRCPTCDDTFESSRAMKVHHAKAHGDSIAGVEVECAHCGDTKTVVPDRVERYNEHFCDNECRGKARRKRTETECHWCGDIFEIAEWHLEQSDRVFCPGKDCYADYLSETTVSDSHPRWREDLYTTVECSCCGDEVERRTDRVEERSDYFFCDRSCEKEWKRENWPTGKDNPLWKGGPHTHYGPNWGEQRRGARERDGYECRVCGITEDELGRELDVHHITPFREFVPEDGEPDYEKANALENLICLCPSHHKQAERMAPLVPVVAE